MTGRRRVLVALPLFLALFACPALAQAPSPARVVAVGDVHGDYDAFVAILQQAGLIDSRLRWTGKNATLVQTGDFLDRGAKCREVTDLLMDLEKQAPRKGGRVVTLLGNHEVMNIMGDLRYAQPMYAGFADKSSEHRRKNAYAAFVAWQKARTAAGKLAPVEPAPDAEAGWMAAHPPGYFEQREALGAAGKYGRWLRERPAVVQIGSTLFVHGGISPDLATWKPDRISDRVRSEVKAFDEYKQHFVAQNIILQYFNLEDIAAAVRAELDYRNAELARKTAEAAQTAKAGKPADTFEQEKKQIHFLSEFLGFNNWFSVHPAGPLWFRGYATWNDVEGAAQVAKLLEGLGVSQIVVGHTPQKDGRIAARFDGKVFLIDTGMLSSYFNGGRASALEITAGKFTAIYPDQRVVLLDPERAIAPADPASREESISGETPGGGLDEQQQAQPQRQPPPVAAQGAAPAAPAPHFWLDPDGKPLPFKTDEEVMEFMRTAKLVSMKAIGQGITHPRKALLEKDGLRMNSVFRVISEERDSAQMAGGQRELFFRDDYIFEPAAYEMSRMLGMDNVPPAVLRSFNGERGSLQVWVEGVMTEGTRQKNKIPPPNARRWNQQIQLMRFFDNLVYNTDRNMGNILIDKDWKVWLIDHTRAFRRHDTLLAPDALVEIDRSAWEKLLALDERAVRERLKPYLRNFEIGALLNRRKKLIEHYRAEIAKRGESEVLREFK
ncbi:MAG: metallophosphoesterase [Acidobacteria bacterium]|nr:metallophosphoesterase [Acidobacteriota bacterium]MBI3664542.1 metallophosphoesterase [Acidobacteriota bacterium]